MVYLTKTDEHEEFEVTNVDDEGNEYTSTEYYLHNRQLVDYIYVEQKKERLIEQLEILVNDEENENFKRLEDVLRE
ncbi:hypothetical protein AMQ84_05080 [Paenibacillus riograndensis]|uniref:Uncharacterized protein n=1 Tax=Paenibacillus riograndensis TaxID=483937 RepID=A0A132U998_9BACL|nr:hypothetical protein [Paenibacillus riograndensis]KWX79966.1 hypothetical protein AMQ84_05080 [Paenibacillus riograndensis]